MIIDEAKEKMKKQAEIHRKMASMSVTETAKNIHSEAEYEWNQITEWLEELKLLRQQNSELQDVVASLECQLGCIREDTIDEFERFAIKHGSGRYGGKIFEGEIVKIADKLREGVSE